MPMYIRNYLHMYAHTINTESAHTAHKIEHEFLTLLTSNIPRYFHTYMPQKYMLTYIQT